MTPVVCCSSRAACSVEVTRDIRRSGTLRRLVFLRVHWLELVVVRVSRSRRFSSHFQRLSFDSLQRKSWQSPGPEDSRGSPERSRGAPSVGQPSLRAEEDRIDPRRPRTSSSSSVQSELRPQHQYGITPSDELETPIVHGGSPQPQQSRLFGYISSTPSTGHQSLPQSYASSGQPFIQSVSQVSASSFHPIASNIQPSSFGNVGERTQGSVGFGFPHVPTTSQLQLPAFPSSRGSSPQHVPQARGRGFSPPPIPYIQAALSHPTSHPQIPESQKLLPSITSLSLDADTHSRYAGRTLSPTSPSTTSSQSPDPESQHDSQKPLPQNLRGDPFRSAKVKTELCRFFNTPKGCVFGSKCNYAHGEQELKFNKLMDLEAAGMVDVEVFRCHVCSTWVGTGSW